MRSIAEIPQYNIPPDVHKKALGLALGAIQPRLPDSTPPAPKKRELFSTYQHDQTYGPSRN